jgi:hypothetical protein
VALPNIVLTLFGTVDPLLKASQQLWCCPISF